MICRISLPPNTNYRFEKTYYFFEKKATTLDTNPGNEIPEKDEILTHNSKLVT